jgi:recombination protein RecR
MSDFPKIFNEVVASFSRFPGIGRKSAERMAFHLLKMQPEEVKEIARKIESVQEYIKPCKLCNNFSTEDVCAICGDPTRKKDTVCIVEEPKDIFAIEKTAQYKGLYYVLLGSVSPFHDVCGEDLKIKKLVDRLEKGEVNEIIIATDPDNDGELTAQFLIKRFSRYKIKIYRIGIGIPLGIQIEYIDSATLGKALLECKPVV